MEVTIIRKQLSMNEQKKYEVIKSLADHPSPNTQRAAITLDCTIRHINHMLKGYKEQGKAYFIHGNRGRKPVNTIPDETRNLVADLYHNKYHDANFEHFTELLGKHEDIHISPSTVMSILEDEYRKYMDELKNLWNINQLEFHGTAEKYRNHYAFKELLDSCYDAELIPYCKKTFNGAQSVIDYLGKYTHRIAISNHRIIRMDDKTVTFSVKDYRNKGQWKELTLSGIEFIRRFQKPQILRFCCCTYLSEKT